MASEPSSPEPNIFQQRPDPAFKVFTRQAALEQGLKLVETEFQ